MPAHLTDQALADYLATQLAAKASAGDVAAKQDTSQKGVAGGYASLDGSGDVPIAQLPTGTTASTVCIGNDSRLSDARTPAAHAASHASAGSDPLTLAQSQVTNLTSDLAAKVSTSRTLTINGTAQDLSANRSWTVTASTPDLVLTKRSATADETVTAGYGAVVVGDYEITSGFVLELASNGVMEIL